MNRLPRFDRSWFRSLQSRLLRFLASPEAVFLALAAIALLLAVAAVAEARPGGGQGYRGGGSRSSGGGGGSSSGGGDGGGLFVLFYLLLRLCFEHPVIGIPLMIVFLVVVFGMGAARMRHSTYKNWESGVSTPTRTAQPQTYAQYTQRQAGSGQPQLASKQVFGAQQQGFGQNLPARRALDAIRKFDQNFSTVLFEDFLYSLYAEVHRARGGNKLDRLSAYLGQEARATLGQRPVAEVSSVIVGAMRFDTVSGVTSPESNVQVGVEFEANYTELAVGSRSPQGLYVVEQWSLSRRLGALSRTPDRARVIGCPSCGAPLDVVTAGRCSHCNQHVNTGAFDWVVQRINLVHRENRGPMLTSNVQEEGTNLPTVVDPNARTAMQALMAKDPQFSWQGFQTRIGLVFSEFQVAWSGRDLARMRPFLSDNLFQTQAYWIETYKAQRLRNVTDKARITNLELAKVGTDRFFDAITVRLYATGLDYTVSDDGNRTVSGSTSKERVYTEYWTFVRGSGRSAPATTDKTCPNCGAPLQINMAGNCEYCQAKVTSGEFDWVLSKIEQDESYEG